MGIADTAELPSRTVCTFVVMNLNDARCGTGLTVLNVFACHRGVPVTSVHLVDSQYEPDAQARTENCGPFLNWMLVFFTILVQCFGPHCWHSCQEVQSP